MVIPVKCMKENSIFVRHNNISHTISGPLIAIRSRPPPFSVLISDICNDVGYQKTASMLLGAAS